MGSLRTHIVTRILFTLPMIMILLTLVFIILRIMPGDPVIAIVGQKASPEHIEELRQQLGLDRPLYTQYFDYLFNIFRLNFGNSLILGKRPVISEILDHFPATIELTIFSFIASVLIGVLTGIYSSKKPGTARDAGLRVYSIISYALFIPWFGIGLQYFFGVYLRINGIPILPISGRAAPLMSPDSISGLYVLDSILTLNVNSLIDSLTHLILPTLTLGIVLSGVYTRLVRTSMLEVSTQDFVRAAKARGVTENKVLYGHVLKNALIPILTMMGLQFAILLGGAVLTETTFSWPGMGSFLMQRIELRDYTTVQGIIVFYALFVSLVSLFVDILYAFVDPRIRY
jgi:peptide/nickel transport system permease protein